jgi:protein-S-isoprenylcysteine O-methyltransferase Ste14
MTALELRVPPVVVTLVFAGLMWTAAAVTPSLTFDVPAGRAIAGILAIAGVAVAIAGVVAFRRAATTVNPVRPDAASSLVSSGVYRLTRNPMYLGFLLALIGWAVWLAHPLSFLSVPLFVAYMSRFQIRPEEQALRARFGESFESYSRSTRRWL